MPNADYEAGKARLVEIVRAERTTENFTKNRKESEAFADRVEALERDARAGELGFLLMVEQDNPPPGPGGAGHLPGYLDTLLAMRALVASARRVAEAYPDSRRRFGLEFAARGFVALRVWNGLQAPTAYRFGPDMYELKALCESAGHVVGEDALHPKLRDALKDQQLLDNLARRAAHDMPGWLSDVLIGPGKSIHRFDEATGTWVQE